MTIDKVKELTTIIGKSISQAVDKDNINEVAGKLMELAALQGNASYTLSVANMLVNEKNLELIEDTRYAGFSATDKKILFAGKAKNELFYRDLAEAQVKSLHYSIEAFRSLLSALKAEQSNAKYQTT